MTEPAPTTTRINGTPVQQEQAIRTAAALLSASRAPVVAGLGTDIEGTRAAVALARAVGASIDHMEADAIFANLDVMRRSGWIVTTPLQVRARADMVLLVGDSLTEAWPDMARHLALEASPALASGRRQIFHLCPGANRPLDAATFIAPLAGGPLPTLAALRAVTAGRPTSLDPAAAETLRTLAAALSTARFGAVIWSAAALDTLAIEMLCGLVDDLNKHTRFAGLPLSPKNGADTVTQAVTWITGFPVRTGFAGAEPRHDPWQFDANRQIASGEADLAIWISAFTPTPPPWGNAVPTIALVPADTEFPTPPAVAFAVGRPGHDHDAMLFNPTIGGIAFTEAAAPSAMPRLADTVAAITAALPPC
jgi:formylmethanofuran dehydrogenase subunit B